VKRNPGQASRRDSGFRFAQSELLLGGDESMRRGLDFEKMEAAFKRAAYKALHGTREERSGRLLPAKRSSVSSALGASKQGTSRRKA
jgi:hypothetical protein